MRFLFSSLETPGFLYPALRVALELQQLGHETLFVTRRQRLLEAAGVPVVADPPDVFNPGSWFTTATITQQARAVLSAVDHFHPHVIIGQPLTLGMMLAAHITGLPQAVIGLAAPIFPVSDRHLRSRSFAANRLLRVRFEKVREMMRSGMTALGQSPFDVHPESRCLTGDLHLLRSVPLLEGQGVASLPEHVRFAGGLLWEPGRTPGNVRQFLARAARAQGRVMYVQIGRSFENDSFFSRLLDVVPEDVWLVVDTHRADQVPERHGSSCQILVVREAPLHAVMPHAVAAVVSGHTTGVLGALMHGLPLLIFPSGSGSEDIAERCARAGAARVVSEDGGEAQLRAQLGAVLDDEALRRAAGALRQAFLAAEAPLKMSRWLEQLPEHTRESAPCATPGRHQSPEVDLDQGQVGRP